jgi:hypothetical protein
MVYNYFKTHVRLDTTLYLYRIPDIKYMRTDFANFSASSLHFQSNEAPTSLGIASKSIKHNA